MKDKLNALVNQLRSVQPFYWIWAGVVLAIAFVLSIDPHHPGESLCYSQQVFGIACPACGMGRAFHSLLHIHLTEALAFNPLVFPAAVYVVLLAVVSLLDFIKGTKNTQKILRFRFSKPAALIAVLIVLLVWIRNLYVY